MNGRLIENRQVVVQVITAAIKGDVQSRATIAALAPTAADKDQQHKEVRGLQLCFLSGYRESLTFLCCW